MRTSRGWILLTVFAISGCALVDVNIKPPQTGLDEGKMKALPAGSIWTEPAKQPHFVWAKDGEAIIQVIGGNGPSAVFPVQSSKQ